MINILPGHARPSVQQVTMITDQLLGALPLYIATDISMPYKH